MDDGKAVIETSRETVELYRALIAAGHVAHLPDLAQALELLGRRLADAGDETTAADVTREAVQTYRGLAQREPGGYLARLASALDALGTLLSRIGETDEAQDATHEAALILTRLARTEQARVDAFVSYARQDQQWVHQLVRDLRKLDLEVFLDEWDLVPGDVLVHRLDEGMRKARNGVVVVSRAAMISGWVREEYTAMVVSAFERRQRVVPVLLEDVELPPLLASRQWVDFREVTGIDYDRRVNELAAALRGERGSRTPGDSGLEPPPGTAIVAELAMRRTLRLTADVVELLEGGRVVASHRPRGLAHDVEERVWELERARRRGPQAVEAPREVRQGPEDSRLHRALLEVGAAIGRAFLVGAAGVALGEALEEAERANIPLELGLEIPEGIAELPWETLRSVSSEGELAAPLVLHPRVRMYRSVPGLAWKPAIQVRGPLRVLVAIGSPESDDRHGELLDYEAELGQILDAVQAARTSGRVYVRILNRGTVPAIREALTTERFHVLHVSCHAKPGSLVLEDERGGIDFVNASRFASEVLPPGRGVPVVVLSGCSTALSERGQRVEQGEGMVALPALGRALLAHGVPAVLAMNAAVSDVYATRLAAQVYHALATAERPDVLDALSDARRRLELVRRQEPAGSPFGEMAEWATPVLMQRGVSQPLYEPTEGFDEIDEAIEPRPPVRTAMRSVGEFVGRRREQRRLLAVLNDEMPGVLVHGLGGVGKSSLAAWLVSELSEVTDLVVSIAGQCSVDQILNETGQKLLSLCIHRNLSEAHPYRELSQVLRQPQLEWKERLGYLQQLVLGRERLLLFLDNFEDNLHATDVDWQLSDPNLTSLLTSWLARPGRSRILVTSRYPLRLPEGLEGRLEFFHLGPLSLSETRKLMWRLPGLDALSKDEQQQAYSDVGGHPRALEYLDALLRGGKARFVDVAERMEQALSQRGVGEPRIWMSQAKGDFDRALAETVTLAVDDVLLNQLLARLEPIPGAHQLLLGASVYRLPVDLIGLQWHVGEELDIQPDPERDERQARLDQARAPAAGRGGSTEPEELGSQPTFAKQIQEDRRQATLPPLRIPPGFDQWRTALDDLGLLAPLEPTEEGEEQNFAVHRWTAEALAKMATPEELAAAHHRAARYWRWRVRVWPQNRQQDVVELIEARYHLYNSGRLEEAVEATGEVVLQLDTWGAYSWEERLCLETLTWLPDGSRSAAAFQHQLGIIAQRRGDYETALDWYRRSLAIAEEQGDQVGMANGYHQLGVVAQERGDYEAALDWYRRSLAIKEEQGDRGGIAGSYHQLGNVAQERGDREAALDWYRHSLAIFEDLGDRAGMASSYHQLGMMAQDRGDHDQALTWYGRALGIVEEQGNRAAMAVTYHQLGVVAQERGDYDGALEWYRRSLAISEELGDRASMARAYHQLGNVAYLRTDYDGALEWYRRSLAISEELGDRGNLASIYGQLGVVAQRQGQYEAALDWYRRSLAISEEVGNWASIAVTCQQLGNMAHERREYDGAQSWYQRALSLSEETGDRAGVARSSSQIGILLTETGRAEEAVLYNLSALSMRLEMRLPQARTDIEWLGRQRVLVGEERFWSLVGGHLDQEGTETLSQLLKGPMVGQREPRCLKLSP